MEQLGGRAVGWVECVRDGLCPEAPPAAGGSGQLKDGRINPSFPLHPFLLFLQDAAISSGCCYFFRYAVVSPISLLLSELYQLIYIFKLMEGKLMLTHTLYSGGTRGQKWRPRQRGSRRMDVDRKIRNSWLFMFQKCGWRGLI